MPPQRALQPPLIKIELKTAIKRVLATVAIKPELRRASRNTIGRSEATLATPVNRDPTWGSPAPGRVEKCRPPQSVA